VKRKLAPLFLLFVALTGCAAFPSTPQGQFAALQDSFIAAQDVLIQARIDGVFDDGEWADIVEKLEEGDEALDLLKLAVAENLPNDQQTFSEQLRKVLALLRPFILKAEGGGS
jgi:hypothetical protein